MVKNILSLPLGLDEALVGQALQLIRYGLYFHFQGGRQIHHPDLAGANQGVQKPRRLLLPKILNKVESSVAFSEEMSGRSESLG